MINSSEGSDIPVFNCYLCHVRFLLAYYFDRTKIGENSDMSKCFEDLVSQALGFLTRNCAAELRYTLEWYDCPRSDGLTKRDKAQNKNTEKQTDTMSFRLLQTTYSHINQCL